jgi:Insulinase (Peptidase family M16)
VCVNAKVLPLLVGPSSCTLSRIRSRHSCASVCAARASPTLTVDGSVLVFCHSWQEDAYSKFVSDHGGHTNAYTAAEDTNYQFDVNWDSLEAALDRFAQVCLSTFRLSDDLLAADHTPRFPRAQPLGAHGFCHQTCNSPSPGSAFSNRILGLP